MPTGRGWAVAGGTVGCYAAGWLLGYPELAVLAAGGALALLSAVLWLAFPVRLRVLREVAPVRVPRGDLAIAVLTCVNVGRWSTGPLRATDRCGPRDVEVDLPPLRPNGCDTTSYVLPTGRRGQLPVGPLRLTLTDPLGLCRRVRTGGAALTLFVQPKTVPVGALPSGLLTSPEGPRSERAAGGTVTFHSLRPYEFGDDLRHVHWRTSARTNTLMVRQLVDTSLPRTIVLLDTRAASYPTEDDFELAVDVTASVALGATARGFPVSVVGGDQPLSTVDGRRDRWAALLDRLALVTLTDAANLPAALVAARPGTGAAALTFVTGAQTVDLQRIAAVRGSYDRVVVVRVGTSIGPVPALPFTVIDAPDLSSFAAAWGRS